MRVSFLVAQSAIRKMEKEKFLIALLVVIQCCSGLVTALDECDALNKVPVNIHNRKFAKTSVGGDWNDRPRPDQKSLIIAFDTTGSMSADLEQLRSAASEIVNIFSAKDSNPIFNYILSLFNDPSKSLFMFTRIKSELDVILTKIKTKLM